jgi:hypothetical protein
MLQHAKEVVDHNSLDETGTVSERLIIWWRYCCKPVLWCYVVVVITIAILWIISVTSQLITGIILFATVNCINMVQIAGKMYIFEFISYLPTYQFPSEYLAHRKLWASVRIMNSLTKLSSVAQFIKMTRQKISTLSPNLIHFVFNLRRLRQESRAIGDSVAMWFLVKSIFTLNMENMVFFHSVRMVVK